MYSTVSISYTFYVTRGSLCDSNDNIALKFGLVQ